MLNCPDSGMLRETQKQILFVDDDELLVELNSMRLGSLGYEVVTSTSSPEALNLFQAEPCRFDLVITDYSMPHMTGIDLARKVHNIRPDIPIILTSAIVEESEVDRVGREVIRAFVPKPVSKLEMVTAIEKALKG